MRGVFIYCQPSSSSTCSHQVGVFRVVRKGKHRVFSAWDRLTLSTTLRFVITLFLFANVRRDGHSFSRRRRSLNKRRSIPHLFDLFYETKLKRRNNCHSSYLTTVSLGFHIFINEPAAMLIVNGGVNADLHGLNNSILHSFIHLSQ